MNLSPNDANSNDSLQKPPVNFKWGLFAFGYALIWLGVFIAGFMFRPNIEAFLQSPDISPNDAKVITIAGWFSACAGGIGATTGILYSLWYLVFIKQDFSPRYIMHYATRPIMGFILGTLTYFLIGVVALIVAMLLYPDSADNPTAIINSQIVIALSITLSWIVGFRQETVLAMINKIGRKQNSDKENL